MLAGSSADALLQQLPRSLTQLGLLNAHGAAPCSVSGSTLALTRLRVLKLSLKGGGLPPLLDALPALQQLQDLSVLQVSSEAEVVLVQQRLPRQLLRLGLLWWIPPDGGEWEKRWPRVQLQHLTGGVKLAKAMRLASNRCRAALASIKVEPAHQGTAAAALGGSGSSSRCIHAVLAQSMHCLGICRAFSVRCCCCL